MEGGGGAVAPPLHQNFRHCREICYKTSSYIFRSAKVDDFGWFIYRYSYTGYFSSFYRISNACMVTEYLIGGFRNEDYMNFQPRPSLGSVFQQLQDAPVRIRTPTVRNRWLICTLFRGIRPPSQNSYCFFRTWLRSALSNNNLQRLFLRNCYATPLFLEIFGKSDYFWGGSWKKPKTVKKKPKKTEKPVFYLSITQRQK